MSWFWDDDHEDVVFVTASEAARATEIEAKKHLDQAVERFNKKIVHAIKAGQYSEVFGEQEWHYSEYQKQHVINFFKNLGYVVEALGDNVVLAIEYTQTFAITRPYIRISWNRPDEDFNKGKL